MIRQNYLILFHLFFIYPLAIHSFTHSIFVRSANFDHPYVYIFHLYIYKSSINKYVLGILQCSF
jgi:hypothetical protein